MAIDAPDWRAIKHPIAILNPETAAPASHHTQVRGHIRQQEVEKNAFGVWTFQSPKPLKPTIVFKFVTNAWDASGNTPQDIAASTSSRRSPHPTSNECIAGGISTTR